MSVLFAILPHILRIVDNEGLNLPNAKNNVCVKGKYRIESIYISNSCQSEPTNNKGFNIYIST
jgi:hypothetical protein